MCSRRCSRSLLVCPASTCGCLCFFSCNSCSCRSDIKCALCSVSFCSYCTSCLSTEFVHTAAGVAAATTAVIVCPGRLLVRMTYYAETQLNPQSSFDCCGCSFCLGLSSAPRSLQCVSYCALLLKLFSACVCWLGCQPLSLCHPWGVRVSSTRVGAAILNPVYVFCVVLAALHRGKTRRSQGAF